MAAAATLPRRGHRRQRAARFAVGSPRAPIAQRSRSARAPGRRGIVDLAPVPRSRRRAPRARRRSRPARRPVRRALAALAGRHSSRTTPSSRASGTPPRIAPSTHGPSSPPLASVRVAVIDSGIDASHPELTSRIAASKSFVPGSATVDTQGHGTFVAGLIAAQAERREPASQGSRPPPSCWSRRSSARSDRSRSRPRRRRSGGRSRTARG